MSRKDTDELTTQWSITQAQLEHKNSLKLYKEQRQSEQALRNQLIIAF